MIAMKPGKRKALKGGIGRAINVVERLKASIRAKVEHPFRTMKVTFNHRKVRYRGLAKNTAQLFTLFGLANLVRARRHLLTFDTRGAS